MCFVWIWEQTAIVSLHGIRRCLFTARYEMTIHITGYISPLKGPDTITPAIVCTDGQVRTHLLPTKSYNAQLQTLFVTALTFGIALCTTCSRIVEWIQWIKQEPPYGIYGWSIVNLGTFNPLNPELNPICYLLALLRAHHFLHLSRIRVKLLTFRLLMSYIWSIHSWCF